ncbi:MAG: cytochrome c3 family protein [Desulfovibrio sp.]|uniref:cytochrome c3 family protein n=1 Tax=Desulfovibrio sp. 7SRBS1 TaxID=3378064 RepID=UPI003B41B982
MQAKYTIIRTVCILLGVVALAGYLLPEGFGSRLSGSSADIPPRILLDNGGGRVIFTHAAHAEDYGAECADCHHEDAGDPAHPVACGTCHPKEFDAQFAAEHRYAFPSNDYCLRCHSEQPDINAAPGSMPDEDKPDMESIPTRMDAFHAQCMGCHRDMGAGPYQDNECSSCHAK